VRKPNGDLLSVTQREPVPIPLGQKVLVIAGNQARVVPDYSAALDPPSAPASDKGRAEKETSAPSTRPVAVSGATKATAGEPAVPLPDPIAAAPSQPVGAAPADTPGMQSGP